MSASRHFAEDKLLRTTDRVLRKSADPSRHNCFISYHADDVAEVEEFLDDFGHVFIPQVIGVKDEDDFVDSPNTDYVMEMIRERYLTNSTVTIVLVGVCTWARKYVDWEVYSTLRRDPKNRLSGLLAITLRSAANHPAKQLPPRVDDNVFGQDQRDGYARWKKYPQSATDLQHWINTASDSRRTMAHKIRNFRDRRVNNAPCG